MSIFFIGVIEKAQALAQLTTSKDKKAEIEDSVSSINNRYQNVQKLAQSNIKQLENCLEVYQQFYDLHKAQQDEQKQLWEKLNSNLDYGGSKQTLEKRLNYITDLQESLPENMVKLNELQTYIEHKTADLPARAQENMQRDVDNLKFDREKFVTTLADIKSALENKLKQWDDYEVTMDKLLSWLADAEVALKSYALKSTLEEKQDQFDKYQVSLNSS